MIIRYCFIKNLNKDKEFIEYRIDNAKEIESFTNNKITRTIVPYHMLFYKNGKYINISIGDYVIKDDFNNIIVCSPKEFRENYVII